MGRLVRHLWSSKQRHGHGRNLEIPLAFCLRPQEIPCGMDVQKEWVLQVENEGRKESVKNEKEVVYRFEL